MRSGVGLSATVVPVFVVSSIAYFQVFLSVHTVSVPAEAAEDAWHLRQLHGPGVPLTALGERLQLTQSRVVSYTC